MKVAEIVPYLLAIGGSVCTMAVGVLCPEVSISLALSVSLSVYLAMVLSFSATVAFTVLLPTLSIFTMLLSFTRTFNPLINFLAACVIWSQVILSIFDIQAVVGNSTGYFFSAYKASMTLSTSSSLHRPPPAPHAALYWTVAMASVAVVVLYRDKKLANALSSVRFLFSKGYTNIPAAEAGNKANAEQPFIPKVRAGARL